MLQYLLVSSIVQPMVTGLKLVIQENFKLLLVGFGIGVVVVASFLTYRYISTSSSYTNTSYVDTQVLGEQAESIELGKPPKDLSTVNVLLLGYGGAGHEGGFLTDVIQVLHLDFDQGKIALISIPRDLWVDLPSGNGAKINRAFSLGSDTDQVQSGGEVAKRMAERVTGLSIDYFIAIDFVGLQRLIGYELGGIEVEVGEVLDDPWYPIKGEEQNTCGKSPQEVATLTQQLSGFELERQFECRYEHLRFNPGKVSMEGGDVLKYVRSRHGSAGGDFSRSKRQHEVLEGIKQKLFTLGGIIQAPKLYDAVKKHVVSDITLEIVEYLQPALVGAEEYDTTTVVLSTENVLQNSQSSSGQFIVVPKNDWAEVASYIQNQL